MKLQVIHTDQAPAAVGPYSQAIKAGDFVYISGQIPMDPAKGELVKESIEAETKQCLENAKAVLAEAGASLEDVVKVTVFIKDMDQFGRINAVYGEYFSAHKPARACVEVARLPLDVNVEIEMIAAL